MICRRCSSPGRGQNLQIDSEDQQLLYHRDALSTKFSRGIQKSSDDYIEKIVFLTVGRFDEECG